MAGRRSFGTKASVCGFVAALITAAPATSAERKTSLAFYSVTYAGSGSYSVDYGNDRLQAGLTTAIGVDGTDSVEWSWKLRTLAFRDRQKPVRRKLAVLQASYESSGNILSYTILQGTLKEHPLPCKDRGTRRTWDRSGLPAFKGDPVRWAAELSYEKDTVNFISRLPLEIAPKTVACYHDPFEGGVGDAYIPSIIRLPHTAFGLDLYKAYRRTDTSTINLPLRHGQVVDANQLHTVKGQEKLSITITRLPGRSSAIPSRNSGTHRCSTRARAGPRNRKAPSSGAF